MPEVELDSEAIANPYALYDYMRRHDGLVRHKADGYYFVARYADVREAAMRPDDFSSAIVSSMLRSQRTLARLPSSVLDAIEVLAVADAPKHALHRRLMKRHFTRSSVALMVESVAPHINRKIDRLVDSGRGDFVVDVAAKVPVEMTLDLLGFPSSDAGYVKRIVDGSVELLAGQFPRNKRLGALAAGLRLFLYTRSRMNALRRRRAGATAISDAMLDAVEAGELASASIPALVAQLIAASVDSTSSLLGNAARALAEAPDIAQRLRDDPALLPAFIEECLRLESPFQGHFRVVRRPTVLAGQELKTGDRLMLLWGAANRDPAAFKNPDELLLNRTKTGAFHVSFGYGFHLCLGAELARAVAKHAIGRLLERTRLVTIESSPASRQSPYLRTLTSLPLRVEGK
jgi:cytochrome P450 family 144